MKYVGLVLLMLFIVVGVGSGCTMLGVSKEDTAMVRNLKNDIMGIGTKRYESIEALRTEIRSVYEKVDNQKKAIMDKVEAKTITLADAERFISSIEREGEYVISRLKDEIQMTKDDFDDQLEKANKLIKDLEAKGYEWWQIAGALLGPFVGGVLVDKKKLVNKVTGLVIG